MGPVVPKMLDFLGFFLILMVQELSGNDFNEVNGTKIQPSSTDTAPNL